MLGCIVMKNKKETRVFLFQNKRDLSTFCFCFVFFFDGFEKK